MGKKHIKAVEQMEHQNREVKHRSVAQLECLIKVYGQLLKEQREETHMHVERKQALTDLERVESEEEFEEPEDEEDPDDPEEKLNPRQKMMYEHYEMCVDMHGKFDQTALGNGAHYAPAAKNPFIKEGLICSNCVFFKGGQGCEIVAGTIQPNAVCKLWIIPNELLKKG
jgi:hypothetical protein